MRKTPLNWIIPAAVIAFLSTGADNSFADVSYIFNGTPYNYFDIGAEDLVNDTFTSLNHVYVELTLSKNLSANLSYNPDTTQPRISTLNWTISDGNVTMNSGNAILDYIQIGTSASGKINAWAIAADFYTNGIPTYDIGVYSGYQPGVRTFLPSYDVRNYSLEWANVNGGQVFSELNGSLANSPDNQWVEVGGSVPEPSTWAMMLLGFAGIGFVRYRQIRRKDDVAFAAQLARFA